MNNNFEMNTIGGGIPSVIEFYRNVKMATNVQATIFQKENRRKKMGKKLVGKLKYY